MFEVDPVCLRSVDRESGASTEGKVHRGVLGNIWSRVCSEFTAIDQACPGSPVLAPGIGADPGLLTHSTKFSASR